MLHFYWAFGGEWALKGAMPDRYSEIFFDTSRKMGWIIATLIVAVGLLLFTAITAMHYDFVQPAFKDTWLNTLTVIIGCIFLLRALGDFNLFGLFKKQKTGLFAASDTKVYIPLCLTIGLISLLISYL